MTESKVELMEAQDMSKDSPLRGELVDLKGTYANSKYRVENYWHKVSGQPWALSAMSGNPAAIKYALRVKEEGLPIDNNVLYGKIGAFGELVHVSEVVE